MRVEGHLIEVFLGAAGFTVQFLHVLLDFWDRSDLLVDHCELEWSVLVFLKISDHYNCFLYICL